MRSEVQVNAEVDWTAREAAAAILLVRAASAPDQEILDEHLEVNGAACAWNDRVLELLIWPLNLPCQASKVGEGK